MGSRPIWRAVLGVGLLAGCAAILVVALVRRAPPPVRSDATGGHEGAPPVPALLPDGQGEPGGTIAGTVSDSAGAPVGGASITLARLADTTESGLEQVLVAVSGEGGHFRIGALPSGNYGLTGAAVGYAPAQKAPLRLVGAEHIQADVSLGREGLLLSGRVLDAGGGALPGARVIARELAVAAARGNVVRIYQATAGADGIYQLPLGWGTFWLEARAPGYARRREQVVLDRDYVHDLRMVPAARIRGRVVEGPGNSGVAAAEVWLAKVPGDAAPFGRLRSDASGFFEFDDLSMGPYTVAARKGNLVGISETLAAAPGREAGDLVVALGPGHRIKGRVLGADRPQGIEKAKVVLRDAGPSSGSASLTVESGPAGVYEMVGALSGRYELSAEAPGYARSALPLVMDRDRSGVDLSLRATTRVAGVVLSTHDAPVPETRVEARVESPRAFDSAGTARKAVLTDAEGRFAIDGLSAGRIIVTAAHRVQGAATLPPSELRSGETKELLIRLARGATVSGRVRFEDGTPAPGVRVNGHATGAGQLLGASTTTDANGAYTLGPFEAGQVVVSAGPSNGVPPGREGKGRRSVSLSPGEEKTGADLEVVRADLSIAGVVLDVNGRPVADAGVSCALERGPTRRSSRALPAARALSGPDGSFDLRHLAPGNYTLWAESPGFTGPEKQGVSAGTGGIELVLAPESSVSGDVLTEKGSAVPAFSLAVFRRAPGAMPARTAGASGPMEGLTGEAAWVHHPSGVFHIGRLAAGSYEIRATSLDGSSGSIVASLASGERRQGVRITLKAGVRITGQVAEYETALPLPGARVTGGASFSRIPPAEATTDGEGRFVLEGLPAQPPLRISVSVEGTSHVPSSKEIVPSPARATVDVGTIRLLRRSPRESSQDRDRGTIGVSLVGRDDGVAVASVTPGQPAAAAGIASGDVLLAVDGRDVRELGSSAAAYLLAGRAGSPVSLTIQSRGMVRTIALTRVSQGPAQ
jgi:hypothetical protein